MIDPQNSAALDYEIRIRGHLDDRWAEWFEGLAITLDDDGDTFLSGPVEDQAALHGLLKKVRDSGLPLVSVNQVQLYETHPYRSVKGWAHFVGGPYLGTAKDLKVRSDKEKKMYISATTTKKIDTKTLLSTLWVVVMVNMLKADILSLYIPGAVEEAAKTAASAGASIPQLMLGGAIIGELAIVMIILSRVLKYGINRWVNIFMGIITIAYIWGGMATYPHYIFIASVETICLLLIIWYAWKWRNIEA